jgi:hypothetical protein
MMKYPFIENKHEVFLIANIFVNKICCSKTINLIYYTYKVCV